ncbi:MAG: hypothetical protein WBP63_03555 [Silvibacterium sp.]
MAIKRRARDHADWGGRAVILVCGGLADSVTELVCSRIEACGYPYRLLDQGRYPDGFTVHREWSGGPTDGWIAGPGWRVELDELSGVYARFLGREGRVPLPDVAPDMLPPIYAEAETGLVALFEDLPCTVVNRYRGGMSNHSKPYQALLVEGCGFKVPETLVTNDPAEAQAFFDEHSGDVIYKSLSGIRSIVRRVSYEHLRRLPLLRQGPAQVQRYIPGDNVRVHVVGEQVFATRVRSDAVDYRYAQVEGKNCEMAEEALTTEIAGICVRTSRRLELDFAGIDLKITPSGEVFCLEVNPSPGFAYYELGTGQPVSAALADLLHAGPNRSPAIRSHPQPAAALSVSGL